MDVVLIMCRELSAQIDADVERRKEQETIRVGGAHPPLHTPTYHNVYTTLKNNRWITRLQVCVCVCVCVFVYSVCVCVHTLLPPLGISEALHGYHGCAFVAAVCVPLGLSN